MTPDQVARARGTRYDPEWWDSAKCRGVKEASYFFTDDFVEIERAKTFCAGCPVIESCAAFAIATRCDGGVWGGMSSSQRDRSRGKLRRTIVEQHGYDALFCSG